MQPDPALMSSITEPLATKSAKIRALNKAGFARADIARFLGIRYQHVRNVLVQRDPSDQWIRNEEPKPKDRIGFSEAAVEWSVEALRMDLDLSADGTLRVPRELLRSAGIEAGETILARVVDGEVRLSGYVSALKRAQWIARHFTKPGASEVDDFIAERRAAGARGD